MKYKYLLFISIIISLCIWGYFSFQRKIIFIEHPTLEINSVFHYQEYIYKIKKGSIKEVTYNAKDLNIHALGHYQVTYFFKGKEYHLKIEVIDSKKPHIKETRSLKIEKGKKYDLKQGLSINDNSHQYLQVIRKISIPIKRDHIQSYTKLLTYQIIKRFLNVK